MATIQLGSGAASSNTHRLTQSSHTIDRRSVVRPTNLAIEEAARSTQTHAINTANAQPSRLVNLRVHASDLVAAQVEPEPSTTSPQMQMQTFVPNVVELGTIDRTQSTDSSPIDLANMVPEEATIEETTINNYTPVIASSTPTEFFATPESNQMAMAQETTLATTSNPTPFDSQDLAMNIAADYATASIGMVENADNSIDTIARATSEAIAAIRTATNPEEIAEQVTSLQAFAENLKANSATPEMLELSNTIDKFVDVAMKSTKVQEEVQKKALQQSKADSKLIPTTLPTTKTPPKKSSTRATIKPSSRTAKTLPRSTKGVAKPTPSMRRTTRTRSTVATDEDIALRKALRNVAAMDGEPEEKLARRPIAKKRGNKKRLVLAFFCAVLCVAGIVYFVGSSIPDISVKVAAIQTGIEASYPSYIPRDYSLSDISSEDGKITMTFKGPEKTTFTLTEEKSSWDSTALLRNYVEPTWQTNYITTHEQGITIYISGANAAWVNGGVLYKINASNNTLTKKQLRNIVTSM